MAHVVADGSATLDFTEWADRTARLADHLRMRGIAAGHLVGLCFPVAATPDAAVAFTAVHAVGAVPVMLSPADVTGPWWQTVGAGTVLTPVDVRTLLDERERADDTQLKALFAAAEDGGSGLTAVVRTSGTTGEPKAVAIPDTDTFHDTDVDTWFPDALLVASPTHSVDGMSHLIYPLVRGRLVVTLPQLDQNTFRTAVQRYGTDRVKLVPAMLRILAESGSDVRPFTGIRSVWLGSAALTLPDHRLLRRLFPEAQVWMDYSSTESGRARLTTLVADGTAGQESDWAGELGGPAADTEVRVVGEDGTVLPTGAIGEIQLRHTVLARRGHLPVHPGDAPVTPVDDWVSTGDLGVRDPAGRVWYHRRKAETANCGGEKIAFSEVEAVFRELDGVRDAAAAAIPDPFLGETIGVLLVTAPDRRPDRETVERHALARLRNNRRPSHLMFGTDLPRSEHGKVQRQRVRDLLVAEGWRLVPGAVRADLRSLPAVLRAMGCERVDEDASLTANGLSSIDLVTLSWFLGDQWQVEVTPAALFNSASVRELDRRLAGR
ncbi:AMP-binding protein [Micromonospora sp. NPDC050187]|uniref:AMP-binding protein n=1 Tax=Micromonospora sp. NPDC050187 TaxID=3364277 RepID=UPI00379A943E